MVVQLVKASIKPDQRDRWLQAIRWNAEQTRAEDGCQGYQVAEDLEAPNNFMIVELWADLETVYTHFRNKFEELWPSSTASSRPPLRPGSTRWPPR